MNVCNSCDMQSHDCSSYLRGWDSHDMKLCVNCWQRDKPVHTFMYKSMNHFQPVAVFISLSIF